MNKINTLQDIISRYKPKIVAIQELNYSNDQYMSDITIPNYKWEMDGLLLKNGLSRSALLIHESIRYRRRNDLETSSEAHVWITVSLPAGRKINFQCWYRQWQEVGINGRIANTNTGPEVTRRMNELADKWTKANQENESITLSDTNINLSNLNKLPAELNPHDRKADTSPQNIKKQNTE